LRLRGLARESGASTVVPGGGSKLVQPRPVPVGDNFSTEPLYTYRNDFAMRLAAIGVVGRTKRAINGAWSDAADDVEPRYEEFVEAFRRWNTLIGGFRFVK
jgi:hypothetical protein